MVDAPEADTTTTPVVDIELRRGNSGFLARRRQEGHRTQLERSFRSQIDARIEALERRVETDPHNFEAQRALGALAIIDHGWERANAHLHLAHELNADDFETLVNYGITLAHRGQLQPALDLLQEARRRWPRMPLVLYNLTLVALQAHKPQIVLEVANDLERLWSENPAIAEDYHDQTQTARGLALLELERPLEAKAALESAARHKVTINQALLREGAVQSPHPSFAKDGEELDPEEAIQVLTAIPEDNGHYEEEGDEGGLQLEGKIAEADLLNNLALAEVTAGELDQAVARLSAALRMEPGHTRVRNNLGVLAYQQGQYALAAKYLDSAVQIEEYMVQPDPITVNNLGVVYSISGRIDDSFELFQRAGKSEHAEFEVYYNLGRACIEHGRPEEGVQFLRSAFAMNPAHADLHALLGAAYLLRGRKNLLTEAIKHLKRATQLNPKHRIALADLAMAMFEIEDQQAAFQVIKQALKINPKSPETLFLVATLTMEHGDEQHFAQAALQFNSVLDMRPDLLTCLYNAGLCQYLMGFRDTAAQQMSQVTDYDPSFAPAYYMIGVGHAVAERYNEALLAWQKAVQYEPGNPDLQANMGYIYYLRGDWQKAIRSFMQAHHLLPTEGDLLAALGLCFARANNLNQAIAAFEHSLRINPHSPITHSNLGLAYYMHKRVEQAVEHWRIVSQLDSGYAVRRGEEQQRNYDDSIVTMRPLNWRARIIKLAPPLPKPHTRLQPGFNARAYRPAFSDPELQKLFDLRYELAQADRILAWMHLKN